MDMSYKTKTINDMLRADNRRLLPAKACWLWGFACCLMVTTACTQSDVEDMTDGAHTAVYEASSSDVNVMLGINIKGNYTTEIQTRMATNITQSGEPASFRGIDNIWLIPYLRQGDVMPADERNGWAVNLPAITADNTLNDVNGYLLQPDRAYGLVANNNSHIWGQVRLPRGTASVLVYGKAAEQSLPSDASADENYHKNGILAPAGIEGRHGVTSAITFSPVAIHTQQLTEGQALADILTDIVNTQYTYTLYYRRNYAWQTVENNVMEWDDDLSDATLTSLYDAITNNGQQIAGSGKALTSLLTSLYQELKAYTSNNNTNVEYNGYKAYYTNTSTSSSYYLKYQHLYNGLRDAIIAKIEVYTDVHGNGTTVSPYTLTLKDAYSHLADYPARYGLPEGCAAIVWNDGYGFNVAGASGDVLITPTDSYCYPPALYYYTNSRLKVSEDNDMHGEYVSSNPSWDAILSRYPKDNATANPDAKSVAVKSPLQYGVAMLKATLQIDQSVSDNWLIDNSPTPKYLDISGNNFPVTGIIIGGQRKQAYNFTPMAETAYFLYDNQITNVYLKKNAVGNTLQTLVLQTQADEDIPIALELRNNSGRTFTGANGNIIPDSKFYLLGMLEMSKAQGVAEGLNSVFQQDHITEVTLKVKDLKKAMNNIPDLREPQLILGVALTIDWMQTTSVAIPLY